MYKRQALVRKTAADNNISLDGIELVNCTEAIEIDVYKRQGITCLAAALYQSQPLSAAASGYPDGVCVVIGSEGQGLTEETIRACNGTVRSLSLIHIWWRHSCASWPGKTGRK